MSKRLRFLAFALVVFMAAVPGCDKGEEEKVEGEVVRKEAPTKKKARVVVPRSVRGQWEAVAIKVTDRDRRGKEELFTVEIGTGFAIPDSDVRIEVRSFLPAFIMDRSTITSASNETRNPAVQVAVVEGGAIVFEGWLFSLYPGAHPFQHPRFSFSLENFLPVEKKN